MGTRGFNGINLTTKRLIDFVAEESSQLVIPGVVYPEARYRETLSKIWPMLQNQVGYYGARSFALQDRKEAYEKAEHYMNLLRQLYGDKEA